MAERMAYPQADLSDVRDQSKMRDVTVVLVKPRGARRILSWIRLVTGERNRAMRALAQTRGELETIRQWADRGAPASQVADMRSSVVVLLAETSAEALDLPPLDEGP